MDLSVPELAVATVNSLEPYWEIFAKGALEEITKRVPTAVQSLWTFIRNRFSKKEDAQKSLDELMEGYQDEDAVAAFRLQLKKLLKEDTAFAREIQSLNEQAQIQINQNRQYHAEMKDSNGGVIAQGENIHIYQLGKDADEKKKALNYRETYLKRVFEEASRLSLLTIDPQAAVSDAKKSVNLGAVYTALLTKTPEERDFEKISDMGRQEMRRLSALEQLNKHRRLVLLGDPGSGKTTFLNFVAICMSAELLGMENFGLKLLRTPLPADEEGEDKELVPQPWEHGALVPVRVVLREFASFGGSKCKHPATSEDLRGFINEKLHDKSLGDYSKVLCHDLMKEGGILLLDGLDEVPREEHRRAWVKEAIEEFCRTHGECRVVVTCRTYAYQEDREEPVGSGEGVRDWRFEDFGKTLLAPFGEGQIRAFVERWYVHTSAIRGQSEGDALGRAGLLKRAIFKSQRIMDLARRPLLLTVMACLHAWRGGSLPERREALYAHTIDLLLDFWEQAKFGTNIAGEEELRQPSLMDWLRVDRAEIKSLLAWIPTDQNRAKRIAPDRCYFWASYIR